MLMKAGEICRNPRTRGLCDEGLVESAAGRKFKAEIIVACNAEKSLVSIALPAQKKFRWTGVLDSCFSWLDFQSTFQAPGLTLQGPGLAGSWKKHWSA